MLTYISRTVMIIVTRTFFAHMAQSMSYYHCNKSTVTQLICRYRLDVKNFDVIQHSECYVFFIKIPELITKEGIKIAYEST
jgi:hypothetical protein